MAQLPPPSHLLVVESDPRVLSRYRILLACVPFTEARSIREAITSLRSDARPSVMISEWNLPDGTIETALHVVRAGGWPLACIIHTDDVQRWLKGSGLVDLVTLKPAWHRLRLYVASRGFSPTATMDPPRQRRKRLRVPVFLQWPFGGGLRRLQTLDLGHGGLSLASHDPLPPGLSISLTIELESGTRFPVDCQVKHSTPIEDRPAFSCWKIGVSFESLDNGLATRVTEIMGRHLRSGAS
jgi:hypothetical protein